MIRISGVVQLPDDPGSAIEVVLQIANDRLLLKRARTNLGDWPLADVGVTSLSATVFELNAAGEKIHFLPSNPQLFGSLEFVLKATRRQVQPTPKKKRKNGPERKPASTTVDASLKEHTAVPGKDALPPSKPAAPEREADSTPEHIEIDLSEETMAPTRTHRIASRTRYLSAATKDQLRQTGVWPLDRLRALRAEDSLPIEHQHTYLVVTTHAGLVRRVCTECGHVSFGLVEDIPANKSGSTG